MKAIVKSTGEVVDVQPNETDYGDIFSWTESDYVGNKRTFKSDALAKKGKRWNAEKKAIEDICEFKRGQAVLVRDCEGDTWKPAIFIDYSNTFRYITSRGGFCDCIDYDSHKELSYILKNPE